MEDTEEGDSGSVVALSTANHKQPVFDGNELELSEMLHELKLAFLDVLCHDFPLAGGLVEASDEQRFWKYSGLRRPCTTGSK